MCVWVPLTQLPHNSPNRAMFPPFLFSNIMKGKKGMLAQGAAATSVDCPMQEHFPRICVVAPLTERSGNLNTATRIANYLQADIIDTLSPSSSSCTGGGMERVDSSPYTVCLLVHALRSGVVVFPELQEVLVDPAGNSTLTAAVQAEKYVLIFGGTDINEFSQDEQKHLIMGQVISRMDAVVYFSPCLEAKATRIWPLPLANKRRFIIRQGVPRCPSLSGGNHSLESVLEQATKSPSTIVPSILARGAVILLPGGLRSVKDPMFAVEGWRNVLQRLALQDHVCNTHLLLVGPPLEEDVARAVTNAAISTPNLHWHRGVDWASMMAWMEDEKVLSVINTSRSEGQAQCILESMMMGKVTAVRSIDTNMDLAVGGSGDHRCAFTFDSPDELGEVLSQLIIGHCDEAVKSFERNAREFVETCHSLDGECAAYTALINTLSE